MVAVYLSDPPPVVSTAARRQSMPRSFWRQRFRRVYVVRGAGQDTDPPAAAGGARMTSLSASIAAVRDPRRGSASHRRAVSGFGEALQWLLLGAMFVARALTDTGLLSRRVALRCSCAASGCSSLGCRLFAGHHRNSDPDSRRHPKRPLSRARSGGISLRRYRARPAPPELCRLASAGETAGQLGDATLAALYQAQRRRHRARCFMIKPAGRQSAGRRPRPLKIAGVTVSWSSWFFAAVVPGRCRAGDSYVVTRVLPPEISRRRRRRVAGGSCAGSDACRPTSGFCCRRLRPGLPAVDDLGVDRVNVTVVTPDRHRRRSSPTC